MSELRSLTNHFCSPFRGRRLWCRFASTGGNLIPQRREDAYICERNSLDFSEFRVVSGEYSLEDSQDSKVDDHFVNISILSQVIASCLWLIVRRLINPLAGVTWLSIKLGIRKLITEYPVLDACLHLAAELSRGTSRLSQRPAPARPLSCPPDKHRRR